MGKGNGLQIGEHVGEAERANWSAHGKRYASPACSLECRGLDSIRDIYINSHARCHGFSLKTKGLPRAWSLHTSIAWSIVISRLICISGVSRSPYSDLLFLPTPYPSLFRANQRKARPTGQALYHSTSDGWPSVDMPAWLLECRVRQQSSMLCSSDTISDTISRSIDRASPRGADLRLVT